MRRLDPNEWAYPNRAPFGLRWLWRLAGRWLA
jgi:hypothetical protein